MARRVPFALLAATAVSIVLVGCDGYNDLAAPKPPAVPPASIVQDSGGITPSSDTSQDTDDDTTPLLDETCTE